MQSHRSGKNPNTERNSIPSSLEKIEKSNPGADGTFSHRSSCLRKEVVIWGRDGALERTDVGASSRSDSRAL